MSETYISINRNSTGFGAWAEARERQGHGQTAPGKTLVELFPQALEGKARDHAAELVGAMVATDILPLKEAEARERMTTGVNQYSPKEIIPEGIKGQARDHAAELVGAMVATDILPLKEAEARERMTTGVNQYSPVEIIPQANVGKARDHAAELVGVNGRYVSEAKRIRGRATLPHNRRNGAHRDLPCEQQKRATGQIGGYEGMRAKYTRWNNA